MSRDLPEFPNLDHLRKQAKVRLRELQQHRADAKLAEAQRAIAREYGFASWNKLKTHVESLPRPATAALADDSAGLRGGGGGLTAAGTPGSNDPGAGLFVRFTMRARRVIFFARYFAGEYGSERIETEHLLRGLVEEGRDLMKRILGNASAVENFRTEIEHRYVNHEELPGRQPIPLSLDSKRILELAAGEADQMGHADIDTGHLWLAFLRAERSPAINVLIETLRAAGIPVEKARTGIIDILKEEAN